MRRFIWANAVFVLSCAVSFAATTQGTIRAAVNPLLSQQDVRVRLLEGTEVITFRTGGPVELKGSSGEQTIPAGLYRITASEVVPAQQRFHLFAKTFPPNKPQAEQAYLAEWIAKGARPESVPIGRRFETEKGMTLDGRVHWISIAQFDLESEAVQKKNALYEAEQWTWMQGETVAHGTAKIVLENANGENIAQLSAPFTLDPVGPMAVAGIDVGFWNETRRNLTYEGVFDLEIGIDGKLALILTTPVEEYLRGVVPAEMPAGWHTEALKAQAVAARSEVLASLNTKHALEGVDFCGVEHCRAFFGVDKRTPATDNAVRETKGELLASADGIAVTVFSSNCGGWTENNDTVWRAPAHGVLRGVSDVAEGPSTSFAPGGSFSDWLRRTSSAYCADDEKYFRWRRAFTQRELSDIVNKRHKVGRVKEIQLGDRGVSGRLKWIRVHGSTSTVTIHKELPIRQAFNGLPSAMFSLDVSGNSSGSPTFTFVGGGRGHGVGMCQYGARGMARRGIDYRAILGHYFSGVEILRYR